jgi:molybdopterin-binding protein
MKASPPVRSVREKLGLSQQDLAKILGTHAMTISKWERGVLRPNEHQRKLLKSFASAADRGPKLGAAEKRDPVRFLSELLSRAHATPELGLGTLSATNRFPGTVVELARGDVMSKVVVEVAPDLRIGAVITTDSVDRLGLHVGSRAIAIIKATEVILGGA